MNSKKWIKILMVLCIVGVGVVGGVNYLVDPFNIFHTKILKTQFQMNERFMKIEYLHKEKDNFNGYMFGSSRIGTTKPDVIEKYIEDSRIYNFTVSGANLYDYEKHLEYLIKNNYNLKTIYLQLDIENISHYERSESDYLRKLHPFTSDMSLYKYYLTYLSGFFPFNIKGKILNNLVPFDVVEYNLETGTWSRPERDKKLALNCAEYVLNEPSFNKINLRTMKYTKSIPNIKALKKIKKLSDENNINLIVFTTPHNKNMMDTFLVEDYLLFLKDISEVTNFFDFSGYNTITLNNCNYHESSHYISSVGDIIAAKIFNDKTVDIPEDFGVLVTKGNIDEHLENLKKQIKEYDLAKVK